MRDNRRTRPVSGSIAPGSLIRHSTARWAGLPQSRVRPGISGQRRAALPGRLTRRTVITTSIVLAREKTDSNSSYCGRHQVGFASRRPARSYLRSSFAKCLPDVARETIEKLQQLMEAIHVLAVTAERPGYFVGYKWRRGKDESRNQRGTTNQHVRNALSPKPRCRRMRNARPHVLELA